MYFKANDLKFTLSYSWSLVSASGVGCGNMPHCCYLDQSGCLSSQLATVCTQCIVANQGQCTYLSSQSFNFLHWLVHDVSHTHGSWAERFRAPDVYTVLLYLWHIFHLLVFFPKVFCAFCANREEPLSTDWEQCLPGFSTCKLRYYLCHQRSRVLGLRGLKMESPPTKLQHTHYEPICLRVVLPIHLSNIFIRMETSFVSIYLTSI